MHISIILLLTWRAALFFLNILSLSIIFFICNLESLIFSYIDKAIYVRTIHIWFPILVTPDIINIHWWDTYLAQYGSFFPPEICNMNHIHWHYENIIIFDEYCVLIKYFNTASVDDMFNFLLEQMNILKNIAENFFSYTYESHSSKQFFLSCSYGCTLQTDPSFCEWIQKTHQEFSKRSTSSSFGMHMSIWPFN